MTDQPIQELHHIGVAVRSLDEALPKWTDGFGLRLESIDEVPTEQVKVAVLKAGATRVAPALSTATLTCSVGTSSIDSSRRPKPSVHFGRASSSERTATPM